MCPDSCANLGLNVQLGVGSPAALAQHMARIQLTQRAEFFLARFGFACSSGKAERCGKVGDGWDGAAGSPRGRGGTSDPGENSLFARCVSSAGTQTERCCARSPENLAESRRNWVILSSRGVFWCGCMADSIPGWQRCSAGWGFSACCLRQKSTKWKKAGKMSKKVVSAQPETSLQPNLQCFLPFAPF